VLTTAFRRLVEEDLGNRVLDLDASAAIHAAELAARPQRGGKVVDIRDTQIAGIALARRAVLAPRNLRHFSGLDVRVVDPWRGRVPGIAVPTPPSCATPSAA
jgi:hypothetical protein